MKHYLTIAIALFIFGIASANPSDSLKQCFRKIENTQVDVLSLQRENAELKTEISTLNETIGAQRSEVDSLKSELATASLNIESLADSLNINIQTTRTALQNSSDSLNDAINRKSATGLWIIIALAIVLIVLAFIFGRLMAKRRDEVASLSMKADKLNEEIIARLTNEMNDMQAVSKQLAALSNISGGDSDSEQKLILTLADRITFMEMTLYKMDSSVRGHKQLSKSIKQMKDNLSANGYELVEMLGKDYNEGMKATVNFVDDDELPTGKQVITGIIKPQINYKGKMIQSAQITVSQNI